LGKRFKPISNSDHGAFIMKNQILTTKEAATLLRVSPLTLWKWHKKGLAYAVQVGVGGRLRWPRREVERLMGNPGNSQKGRGDSNSSAT
jgi:excisionase family DNA binding protein